METIAAFIRNNPTVLILVVVGIAIRLLVNRRRFYRRGMGGLQHFNSYCSALITRIFERLLMGISILLFIAALFIFITAHK